MTAKTYAKGKGFEDAKRLCEWHGYVCYEAVFSGDKDEIPFVGYPQIILERNGECMMASYDEAIEIIRTLEDE